MAAQPKKPQTFKLEMYIDKDIYDDFVRTCVKTRYAPKVVVERLLKKYIEGIVQI
jgi:hypothetical protein